MDHGDRGLAGEPSYCMVCHSVEIYSQGVWAAVKDVEDPELQELVDKLPNTILHSRANSTVKKLLAAYKRWKSWAKKNEMPAIPAKEHHVGFYLQHLADTIGSKSAVEEACNSLAWVHSTAGLVSPSSVKAILRDLWLNLLSRKLS